MSKETRTVSVTIPKLPNENPEQVVQLNPVVHLEEPVDILVKQPRKRIPDIKEKIAEAKKLMSSRKEEQERITKLPEPTEHERNELNFDVIEKVAYFIQGMMPQMKVIYDFIDQVKVHIGQAFTMSEEKIESFNYSFFYKVPVEDVIKSLNQLTSNINEESIVNIVRSHERIEQYKDDVSYSSKKRTYMYVYDLFKSIRPVKDGDETELDEDHPEDGDIDHEEEKTELLNDPIGLQFSDEVTLDDLDQFRDTILNPIFSNQGIPRISNEQWNIVRTKLTESFLISHYPEDETPQKIGGQFDEFKNIDESTVLKTLNDDMMEMEVTDAKQVVSPSSGIKKKRRVEKSKETQPSSPLPQFVSLRHHQVDYGNLPHITLFGYLGIRNTLVEVIQLNYHDVITTLDYDVDTSQNRWITQAELLSHTEVRYRFAELVAVRLKKKQYERDYAQIKFYNEVILKEHCLMNFCFPSVFVEDEDKDKRDKDGYKESKNESVLSNTSKSSQPSQDTPKVIKKILKYDDTLYRDASEKYRMEQNTKRK